MKTKLNLTMIIGLTWMVFIILGYYLIHSPLPEGIFSNILNAVWLLFCAFSITALAGGIGTKLYKFPEFPPLSRISLQAGLGFGVLAVFILALGSLWKVTEIILLILVPLGLFLLWNAIKEWFKNFSAYREQWRNGNGFQKWLMILIVAILLSVLWITFAPAIKYDTLNYHFTLPKAYLLNQKITDLTWLVMSGMPQTTEMLYLAAMALGGESAALVLNWLFGFLTVTGLVGFISHKINQQAAWAAAAALLGGSTLVSALAWGYVGWLSALFGFCVIVMMEQVIRGLELKKYAFLAGCFGGLAFSTKYPAGVILAAGGLVLLWQVVRKKQIGWAAVWNFGFGGVMCSLPWLLKNYLFTGNPLYPFFWESGAMDAVRIGVYQGAPTFGDWTDLFFLPLKAFLTGVEGTMGYSVSTGPLLLGLGVLAFLGWTEKSAEIQKTLGMVGGISLLGFLIWALGNQLSGYMIQTRFYFVLFPAFAVLAGFGYQSLSAINVKRAWFQKTIQGLVVGVLALNLVFLMKEVIHKGALALFFGEKTRAEYVYDNLGWYAAAVDAINQLPEGSKVMMLYEPRGYGCLPKCDQDEILDRWKTQYPLYGNYDSMHSAWKTEGYTHLLVFYAGVEFLRSDNDPHHPLEDLQALDVYLVTLPAPVDFGGVYALYDIP